jgi:hypothetical protein
MNPCKIPTFKSGTSTLFVYRSQYAGTNKATAVTWVTDEVEDIVETRKVEASASSIMICRT